MMPASITRHPHGRERLPISSNADAGLARYDAFESRRRCAPSGCRVIDGPAIMRCPPSPARPHAGPRFYASGADASTARESSAPTA